ncbi:cysteine desulfurase [Sesbania bispinosa]|nr:cysteine desulfurase [Sesbania bispinosa]
MLVKVVETETDKLSKRRRREGSEERFPLFPYKCIGSTTMIAPSNKAHGPNTIGLRHVSSRRKAKGFK